MCKALRLEDALEAGGGESLYDDIDCYESSAAFTEAQKVALRLADAVLFTPAVLSDDLVEQVRRHFTGAQIASSTSSAMPATRSPSPTAPTATAWARGRRATGRLARRVRPRGCRSRRQRPRGRF